MSLTRRQFTGALSASLAAPLYATERPNIILCMGDDHGWNETGYNGHPHLKTPVLDEMARVGLRLDQFYSAHPNCSPTRGSVMTGRHPNRYGTFAPGWSIRPEEITIAHILRKAGYTTGHFGKWHLGPVKADSPTNPGKMGFDQWLSHDNFYEVDPWFSRNGNAIEQIKGESSEIVVREALSFIEKARRGNRPSFTVIWFGSPHEPYVGTEPYLSLYKDLKDPLRSRLAEVSAMDTAIGQLRSALTRLNLRQNTILWYCGDNGTPPPGNFSSPYRGAKGAVYEGGVRIPGLIEWPARIPKPIASSVPTVTSDILPTICDILDLPLPNRPLDGISLKPLLSGRLSERPKPIFFWEFPHQRESREGRAPYIDPKLQQGTTPTATMRSGKLTRDFLNFRHPQTSPADLNGPAAARANRFKLVLNASAPSARELFDLNADRAEATNIASAHPTVATQLETDLRAWQQSVLRSLTGADY